MKFELVNHETLPHKIATILRDAIIQGKFKPGERLIQDELATSLGVSRMPIREAFKQLQAEGYVTLEPHKGAIVKSFTIQELDEIYLLRSKLEPLAVRESLKWIDEQTILQLEAYQEQMKATSSIHEYVELNIKFHSLLIKDCKLKKLNLIIQSLWTGLPQQTPHLLPNQIELSLQEHDGIIQSIKHGKLDETCAIVESHIVRAGKNVLDNLKK